MTIIPTYSPIRACTAQTWMIGMKRTKQPLIITALFVYKRFADAAEYLNYQDFTNKLYCLQAANRCLCFISYFFIYLWYKYYTAMLFI